MNNKSSTVVEEIANAARRLTRAGVRLGHGTSSMVAEAAFLVGETIGVAPDYLPAIGDRPVSAASRKLIDSVIGQRIKTRKPASYLTQSAYMHGIKFFVDERVIVPRSFIGELLFADHIVGSPGFVPDASKVKNVLDLCTGSGCLAVIAAKVFPRAKIDAVDLSEDALDVAAINLRRHGLADRIKLHCGDLFDPLPKRRYDLIISNPPYVAPASMKKLPHEYRREPAMALAGGGADGLGIVARLLAQAPAFLNERGALLCEVGAGGDAMEKRFPKLPFLWLDTAETSGEVFWLTATDFRAANAPMKKPVKAAKRQPSRAVKKLSKRRPRG